MDGRIKAVIDVPPDLVDAPFPPLLLISLVENAVKHGIEPKPGPGMIAIRGRIIDQGDEPRLAVSVEDDGAGLQNEAGAGVGLANVRAQLLHRFGPRARLDVTSREGGGVTACIAVPMDFA
jgi:sensor histidine kinase YesM